MHQRSQPLQASVAHCRRCAACASSQHVLSPPPPPPPLRPHHFLLLRAFCCRPPLLLPPPAHCHHQLTATTRSLLPPSTVCTSLQREQGLKVVVGTAEITADGMLRCLCPRCVHALWCVCVCLRVCVCMCVCVKCSKCEVWEVYMFVCGVYMHG